MDGGRGIGIMTDRLSEFAERVKIHKMMKVQVPLLRPWYGLLKFRKFNFGDYFMYFRPVDDFAYALF